MKRTGSKPSGDSRGGSPLPSEGAPFKEGRRRRRNRKKRGRLVTAVAGESEGEREREREIGVVLLSPAVPNKHQEPESQRPGKRRTASSVKIPPHSRFLPPQFRS